MRHLPMRLVDLGFSFDGEKNCKLLVENTVPQKYALKGRWNDGLIVEGKLQTIIIAKRLTLLSTEAGIDNMVVFMFDTPYEIVIEDFMLTPDEVYDLYYYSAIDRERTLPNTYTLEKKVRKPTQLQLGLTA